MLFFLLFLKFTQFITILVSFCQFHVNVKALSFKMRPDLSQYLKKQPFCRSFKINSLLPNSGGFLRFV